MKPVSRPGWFVRFPYPGDVVAHWWCPVCERAVHRRHRPGRAKVYCSNACRQRAYRWRRDHGVRLIVTPSHPAERGLSRERRHALRAADDNIALMVDSAGKEVAVCGTFVRPARHGRWTHHNFVVDHSWSCRSCRRLVGVDD